MVMRADVIDAALRGAGLKAPASEATERPLIYLTPRGQPITQARVRALAAGPGAVILCGRFEGIDQRVVDEWGMEDFAESVSWAMAKQEQENPAIRQVHAIQNVGVSPPRAIVQFCLHDDLCTFLHRIDRLFQMILTLYLSQRNHLLAFLLQMPDIGFLMVKPELLDDLGIRISICRLLSCPTRTLHIKLSRPIAADKGRKVGSGEAEGFVAELFHLLAFRGRSEVRG